MDLIDTAQEYMETIEQIAIDNARKDVDTTNPSGCAGIAKRKSAPLAAGVMRSAVKIGRLSNEGI